MSKTNKERLLDYLWSVTPKGASNAQIREALGVKSHQSIYMLTQELKTQGLIIANRPGKEWLFHINESAEVQLFSPGRSKPSIVNTGKLSPRSFENLARQVMETHLGVALNERLIPGVPKRFDMASENGNVVGDAKYYSRVRGKHLPPAKFSVIAEHVWLLEKVDAEVKFLVFGNDIEVPRLWLARFKKLVNKVDFYFLSDDGELTQLR